MNRDSHVPADAPVTNVDAQPDPQQQALSRRIPTAPITAPDVHTAALAENRRGAAEKAQGEDPTVRAMSNTFKLGHHPADDEDPTRAALTERRVVVDQGDTTSR